MEDDYKTTGKPFQKHLSTFSVSVIAVGFLAWAIWSFLQFDIVGAMVSGVWFVFFLLNSIQEWRN